MVQIFRFKDPDRPTARRRGPHWPVIFGVLALAGAVVALIWWLPDLLVSDDDRVTFVSRLVVLAMVVAAAAVHWRGRLHVAALQALAWAGICVVVILTYSFRHEFAGLRDRVMGELMPHRAIASGAGEVTIRAAADGHFHVDVDVDGTSIRFMVDTGATGIALSRRDADRLGFDRRQLQFTQRVQTANGTTMVAPVRLKAMQLGPIAIHDIGANVNNNLDVSLLGMTFLDRLGGYEVRNGVLTLRR